jgi:cytochrome P450
MNNVNDDDVVSPQIYSDEERLHAMFAALREHDPVRWTEASDYRPFWAISKYEDIAEIETNSHQFLAGPRNRLLKIDEERRVWEKTGRSSLLRSLPSMDAPEHRRYRSVTQGWFAPANLKKLEDQIRAIVDERLDRAQNKNGALDFVSEVSLWVPLRTIMLIFGMPVEDGEMLHRLAGQLFSPLDPDTARKTEGHGTAEAAAEFFKYFEKLINQRRSDPTDDLLTVIANATVDGEPIDDLAALSYCVSVFVAGHDTTASTIAGGLHSLITHPDQFAAMRDGLAEIPAAVEEMLRWVSPARSFMRVAVEDYVLRGKTIRAGDSVLLLYPSGNRDEDKFPDANSFRVNRSNNAHMAFGAGPHMCLGQMLARLEIRTFFRRFFERVESAELAGPASWMETNFLGGLKSMPVRLRYR